MPILEQGYEPYRGPVHRGRLRFASIAITALRRNHRWYMWVLLVLSWLFGSAKEYFLLLALYVPAAIFGRSGDQPNPFMQAFSQHPGLYADMMATQTFWAIVMGVVVGAGEIAEDIRTGALVFYLGRPLTRLDYVLGKVVAVSVPVLLVTLLPVALLFVIQALFEGNWAWVADHARVIPAATGYALLVSFFVSGFVLGISAVARRRRWATVSIAALLLGLYFVAAVLAPSMEWTNHREKETAFRAIDQAKTKEERAAAFRRLSDLGDPLGSGSGLAEFRALSPSASLGAAGRDLFGNPLPSNFPWHRHWIWVLGVPAAMLALLWRRVRAVEIVT